MLKIDSNLSTFLIATTITGGILFTSLEGPNHPPGYKGHSLLLGTAAEAQSNDAAPKARWAASATGRVEPVSGTVRIAAQTGGTIEEVLAKIGENVSEGDVLVALDSDAAHQRVVAALAEVEVRKLEREDEPVTGLALERREAEDEEANSRRELFNAWRAFDDTMALKRNSEARDSDVTAAREAVQAAQQRLTTARAELKRVSGKSDMPLPGRLDTSLTIARADLALAEEAFQKTRVRAPFDGAVLNVLVREGETAAPGPQSPLVVFGDVSKLKVRAEVEERDVAKVRVGQKAVVRSDAYPGQEFEGVVVEVSGALGSPQITSRGPRRPNDVDVLEVLVDLEGTPPLLTGMRVDVFFHRQEAKLSRAASVGDGSSH